MSRRLAAVFLSALLALALGVTTFAGAENIRKGNLLIKTTGDLSPTTLPRDGTAPIKVTIGGNVTTVDKTAPPKLTTLAIDLNSNGQLDTEGLPLCPYGSIQPGSSSRALSACKNSLVGKGTFNAEITLAGQDPYPTRGKMLMFNGKEGGTDVLYGHIYAARPFATSFVIVFKVKKSKGTFGTSLAAKLPASLLNWGNITGIEIALQRSFKSGGKSHSFLSAGCPTPKGVPKATFPLTRTTFGFDNGQKVSSTLIKTCKAR